MTDRAAICAYRSNPHGVPARAALQAHARLIDGGSNATAMGFGRLKVASTVRMADGGVVEVACPEGFEVEVRESPRRSANPRAGLSCIDGEPGMAYASDGRGVLRFPNARDVEAVNLWQAQLEQDVDRSLVGSSTPIQWVPVGRRIGSEPGDGVAGFGSVTGLWWSAGEAVLYVAERQAFRQVLWSIDTARRQATVVYSPPHPSALVQPEQICSDDPGAGVLLVEQPGPARISTVRFLGSDGRVSPLLEVRGPAAPLQARFDARCGRLLLGYPAGGLVVSVSGRLVLSEESRRPSAPRAAVQGRSVFGRSLAAADRVA